MSEIKTEVGLEIINSIKNNFDKYIIEKELKLNSNKKYNMFSSKKFIVSLISLETLITIILYSFIVNIEQTEQVLKYFLMFGIIFNVSGSFYDFFKWVKLRTGFYNPLCLSKDYRRKKYWKSFKNKIISPDILNIIKKNLEETYVISLIHKHDFNISYKDLTNDMIGLKINNTQWQMAKTIYDCIK